MKRKAVIKENLHKIMRSWLPGNRRSLSARAITYLMYFTHKFPYE